MFGCRVAVGTFLTLFGFALAAGGCAAQTGTDIPVMVMADDGDQLSLPASDPASQYIATKIKEQLNRYNYYVVDQNAVAAAFGFDFRRRMDSPSVMRAAMQAKKSGRAEFDARGIVIYKVYAQVKDIGFAKQMSLEVAGEVHDADASAYLGDFGPISRSFPASADCTDHACISAVLREKGAEIAAIVADEARKKLALLTKTDSGVASSRPVVTASSIAGAAGPRLVTAYNLRFENFQTNDVLKIKGVMEGEFPDFVRAGKISGADPDLQYGYVSRAPQDKMFEWMNILLSDMGMKNTQIIIDGNNITIKNLASDLPPATVGQAVRFR